MKRFASGYIEGYYGRLFTFEERLGIVRKLRDIGATHYLYAPKEDVFHRRDWRKPYPAPWLKRFKIFVASSRRLGIQVVPGLAPGLSYSYQSRRDFESLAAKVRSFARLGCRELALLMDDISPELPKADAEVFISLGQAHALLLKNLRLRFPKLHLWFCPTVYCDAFAPKGVLKDVYLRDLARGIPRNIPVMWTGPAIISERLAPADLSAINKVLGRKTVLWDNLYANDYCPGKIFLGPFSGRPAALRSAASGLLLNPTGLYRTDLFLLDLLGGFLKGGTTAASWKRAVQEHQVPRGFLKIAGLLASPFGSEVPSAKSIGMMRRALKPLIWDWKSPLQREWYPYLYALDADLRLLSEEDKPDARWISKKYSPVISKILLASAPLSQRK